MRKIDTSDWKSVNLTDLFEISKGKSKETAEGKTLVTCSTVNNGKHPVKKSDNHLQKKVITVTANGAPGVAFYQSEEIGVCGDVNILKLKNKEINEYIGVFLATVITKSLSPKYSYSKKLGLFRIMKESILLPHDNNGEINWNWIENFTADRKKERDEIEQNKPKYRTGKVDISSWKSFNLTDLFESNVSKKLLGEEDCWEVTGQTTNNGRRKKVSNYNQENIFTIASVGAYCGTCFWHPYKFWLGNNTQGYKPKFEATDNIGLFIATVITKSLRPKFSYGKTASIERVMKESIFLPEKDGEVDWAYMETFINSLIIQ